MPAPGGKLAADSPKPRHSGKENSDPDNKNSRRVHGKTSLQAESFKKLSSLNLSNDISMHSFGSINETGLNTPPPSQSPTDMDRNTMLISPPPEEILRSAERRAPRRPSVHFKDSDVVDGSTQMAHTASASLTASKRKRSIVNRPQSEQSSAESAVEISRAKGSAITPNPRLKKQTKRSSHVRTISISSTSSQTSPTESTFLGKISTPNKLLGSEPGSSRNPDSPRRMLVDSPHASNPNADFFPKWPLRKHDLEKVRSSSIPYEPPRERFTPPREILSTPLGPSKPKVEPPKKTVGKRSPVKEIKVKIEPPHIDSTIPPAPASPSDDPILLIGSSSPEGPAQSRAPDRSTSPFHLDDDVTQLADMQMDLDISGLSSTMTPERPSTSAFNINWQAPAQDNWSDSDEDIEEDEGDYTGKFKAFKVPIKADPPTSGTRHRMEEWGRPISPHPFRSSRRLSDTTEEPENPESLNEDIPSASDDDVFSQKSTPSRENASVTYNSDYERSKKDTIETRYGNDFVEHNIVSEKAVEPEFTTDLDESINDTVLPNDLHNQENYDSDDDQIAEVDKSLVYDEDESTNTPEHVEDIFTETRSSLHVDRAQQIIQETVTSGNSPRIRSSLQIKENNAWKQSASIPYIYLNDTSTEDRSLNSDSETLEAPQDTNIQDVSQIEAETTSLNEQDESMTETHNAESSDDSDSEEPDGPGVIRIVSDDPLAAARAAAILKQHHYDLLALRSPKKSRRSSNADDAIRKFRRKSASQAGVTKSLSKTSKRRQTFGGFADGKVFIPGSSAISIPELLQKAEAELEQSRSKTASPTKSAFDSPGTSSASMGSEPIPPLNLNTFVTASKSQVWSKDDWKLLDRCFLDERCELAADRGIAILVDAREVHLNNVVDRFITISGGSEIVGKLGVDWTRDRLLKRAGALRRRQNALDGSALPTSQITPFGSPSMSDISTVIFTPTPAERFRKPLYPILDANEMSKPASKLSVAFPVTETPSTSPPSPRDTPDPVPNDNQDAEENSLILDLNAEEQDAPTQATPASVVKRSFGYFYSWLGKGQNSRQKSKIVPKTFYPALPIPPSEVRSRPRGPVTTPSRKPAEKVVPPKDQVSLNHNSPPPETRILFRKPPQPKRIVELRKATLPASPDPLPPRPRTVSSGSVKDLVRGFEQLQQKGTAVNKALEDLQLKRTRSVGDLRGKKPANKPVWRP